MSTRRYFIVAMLGLAVGACGGKKGGGAPVPQPRTSVRVENQGFSDMTIYAIRSGQKVRLGNAPGNSTTTFTIPSNLAGLPGLSIPCGLSDGLPVGLQLIGRQFAENLLFRAGHALERALGFDYVPERYR